MKKPIVFREKGAIAKYLNITRMTLYRWTKILPIPEEKNSWGNIYIESTAIDQWKKQLKEELNVRGRRGLYY